jgi:hypothetical protein
MGQKRQERLEGALALLEAEFRARLIEELRRCEQGRWGLFGQNSHLDIPARLKPQTPELDRLGAEIEQMRNDLGLTEPFALHDRLLKARGRKTENDLGEARLAAIWLRELGE